MSYKNSNLYFKLGHIITVSSKMRTAELVAQNPLTCCCQVSQRRTFFNIANNSSKKKYYNGRKLVGYSMEQLFSVVSDVGNYNKFVPFCNKSIILNKSTDNLKAALAIGFPPINESYTSNVTLVRPYLVKAVCTEGRLFDHLLTVWKFSPGLRGNDSSCVIDFQVAFAFRSVFHSQLANLFFDQVVLQMEGAFLKEVTKRYGKASIRTQIIAVNNART